MPLLFGNILKSGKRVLAQIDMPPVCMTGKCPINNWVSVLVLVVVLLVQSEEQPWPPRLWRQKRVLIKIPMKEMSVRVFRLSFFPNIREGRYDLSTIYIGDILPSDNAFVVGNFAPVDIERRAELV